MVFRAGVDTGVQKASGECQPNFMKFFAKEEQQKKAVRSKQPMTGPQNISYYFPDIPDGMDLRDFVSLSLSLSLSDVEMKPFSRAKLQKLDVCIRSDSI